MPTLTPIDPATEPFLSGRFRPGPRRVLDVERASEVSGTLPDDLAGAYLRNGPNPEFPPLWEYTYPSRWRAPDAARGVVRGQSARYANRFVRTQGLRRGAGRPLAVRRAADPAFVDQSCSATIRTRSWPFKLGAFVNVVTHGGRLLALEEGTTPYEVAALETAGQYDFGGGLPDGITAHQDRPGHGEMVVFRYDVVAPFLTWATVGADGVVTQPPVAIDSVDEGYLIRDRDHQALRRARHQPAAVRPTMMSGGQPLA